MAKEKKYELTPTQRKLKNARERVKRSLKKRGFSIEQITYLLSDFRSAFTNKAGIVNVGKLTNKQIDKKINIYTLDKGGVKLTFKDLLDRIRDYISGSNDTKRQQADNTYYMFMDAFGDEWLDEYEDTISVMDLNEVLRKLYANIDDKGLRDSIENSIDMMIKDTISNNIE